jgi:hypothetical protein
MASIGTKKSKLLHNTEDVLVAVLKFVAKNV